MPTPESPTSSAIVAGTDVNNFRRNLRTDENGDLLIGSAGGGTDTVDAADGSIGAPVPVIAIQIGGEDGSGNLKNAQFDSSGNLKVAGVGAPNDSVSDTGSAVPAKATYVGGEDVSGNLQGLSFDASGNLKVTGGGSTSVTLSKFHRVAAGSGDAANVKASPGSVYFIRVFNATATPKTIYLKFHNTAGTPAPGSGVTDTFGIQAGTGRSDYIVAGLPFSTGIGISIVTGIADNSSTGVAANDCVVDIYYA